MNNFLLELMVEEIPSGVQTEAISEFEKLVTAELEKCRIRYKNSYSYISPRRIVFSAELNLKVDEFTEEKKGPQITATPEVIERFLHANSVSRRECIEKEVDKKIFLFIKIKHKVRDTSEVLGNIIKNCTKKILWNKSMRWGNYQFYFVRPLRNVMAIFNGNLLDIKFDEINLVSCNHTYGHRFIAPQKIEIANVDEYFSKMKNAFVILDAKERRNVIIDEFKNLESQRSIFVEVNENLLDEVVGLVEYPVVLLGRIPERFMKLPEEVITTPLRVHQRYFPTRIDGKLAPYFVFIANNVATDGGKTIIEGNERVLNARLADALFFFETDLQCSLESRRADLRKIAFNDKLGNVLDRANRVSNVCDYICNSLEMEDSHLVKRSSILAKCDLATSMVCEFPELQGIMGAHYARIQGEDPAVCDAIRCQYLPVHEITSSISAILSLADKIELVTTFFALEKKPTGSKDPFALRRAAIGILKITEKFQFDFNLKEIIQKTFQQLPDDLRIDTVDCVHDFILGRLKIVLKEMGIQQNILNATVTGEDSILNIFSKSKVLNDFLQNSLGEKLLIIHKRTKNIILLNSETFVDEKLLQEKEEITLWEKIKKLEEKFSRIAIESESFIEKFTQQLSACAEMAQDASVFFDKILVNTDDSMIRQNRLNLLTRLSFIFDTVIPAGL
ncbi:MAG: glycine--tRNA ligase subunit beta [Holosporaceae bacterium]|jgi:glycyl-tRNA synthetase beta chain|nr:glycine--tRNA ligase subunit beta [Holosporaceae bacterium]